MKHYPMRATQAKLSHDDVREIRKMWKRPKQYRPTLQVMGDLYGVCASSIKDVVKGYTYRYVSDKKESK